MSRWLKSKVDVKRHPGWKALYLLAFLGTPEFYCLLCFVSSEVLKNRTAVRLKAED